MKKLSACAILAALMLVQGCGGRSAGVPGGALVPEAHGAVPTAQAPALSPALSKQDQAIETDAALAMLNTIRMGVLFATFVHKVEHKLGASVPATAPECKNGVEQELTQEGNVITYKIGLFYDAACTTKGMVGTITATLGAVSSQGDLSFKVSGKLGAYDPSGKVLGRGRFGGTGQGSSSGVSVTTHGVLVPIDKSKPALRFGMSCDLPSKGSNSCGFAGIERVTSQNADLGFATTIKDFTDNGTSDGTVTLKGFQGTLDTLYITQTKGTTWAVKRGTKILAEDGTFHEVAVRKTLDLAIDLKATDTTLGAASTAALANRGISGQVKPTSGKRNPATFQVDPLGTGMLTYRDGSTGNIALFVVLP